MRAPLLAIGPHVFESLPLSLQKIEEQSKVNWPAIARFGVQAARQFTGYGEDDSFKVEGLIFEDEWAGHESYLALKTTSRAGQPLMLVGWGAGASFARVFGSVVILSVGATHSYLRPDGVGRKIEFSIELAPFGGDIGGVGGLFG